jgi:hypothetical protein
VANVDLRQTVALTVVAAARHNEVGSMRAYREMPTTEAQNCGCFRPRRNHRALLANWCALKATHFFQSGLTASNKTSYQRSSAWLDRGNSMVTADECRERATDCRQMAEREHSHRVRLILIDMARTWERLALEAEHTAPQTPKQVLRARFKQ